ncbi:hypothetical protein BOTBODRAFT_60725 [Botryobasidium botryosum FD-172 SS1]|uniref:Uncharacterized protein n=1 Tax=Botryobasidium botryosum (strain FD-172 SS1) TaxID=930990 RepID=A0A067LSH6_BOTB1|nr:hypothetical protein BOTBODRAFT_60725 [Botryobasidium botryosum FD-172 SS1]
MLRPHMTFTRNQPENWIQDLWCSLCPTRLTSNYRLSITMCSQDLLVTAMAYMPCIAPPVSNIATPVVYASNVPGTSDITATASFDTNTTTGATLAPNEATVSEITHAQRRTAPAFVIPGETYSHSRPKSLRAEAGMVGGVGLGIAGRCPPPKLHGAPSNLRFHAEVLHRVSAHRSNGTSDRLPGCSTPLFRSSRHSPTLPLSSLERGMYRRYACASRRGHILPILYRYCALPARPYDGPIPVPTPSDPASAPDAASDPAPSLIPRCVVLLDTHLDEGYCILWNTVWHGKSNSELATCLAPKLEFHEIMLWDFRMPDEDFRGPWNAISQLWDITQDYMDVNADQVIETIGLLIVSSYVFVEPGPATAEGFLNYGHATRPANTTVSTLADLHPLAGHLLWLAVLLLQLHVLRIRADYARLIGKLVDTVKLLFQLFVAVFG